MTDKQLGKIIEGLRSGLPLEQALKTAKVSQAKYTAALEEDPDLESILVQHSQAQLTAPPPAPPAPLASAKHEPPPAIVVTPPAEPEDPGLDKEAIAAEAAKLAPGMFGYVLWVDARCVDFGMPAMSAWWRSAISGFYASGKRWGIFEVGRGGGKSSTLERIAGAEGMFGERHVPPGQRWIWPFISVNMEDAGRRIVGIDAVLRAIGVDPEIKRPNGRPMIEINDVNGQAIAFICLASNISSVSGPNAIGATVDEEAKLRNRANGANPSSEILASLANTFRAREGIRGIRCSSAWDYNGSHAQSIAEGDNGTNYVARIGASFLQDTLDGLYEVAEYELSIGLKANADKIRRYARTVTEHSPNVPTWVANPTIGALASRMEINVIPLQKLGGLSRADYWLRENASLPIGSGSVMACSDLQALANMNKRLNSGANRREGLLQFDGLSDFDPRSHAFNRRRDDVL